MCRNPLYFFSSVGSIGVSCATETFTIPLLTALAFGIYYPSVMGKGTEKDSPPFSETPTGTIAGTFPPSFPSSHGLNRRLPPTPSIPPHSRTTLWMRCGSSGSSASLNSSADFMKPECFPCGSSFRNRLFSPGIQKPRKRPLGNHLTERCAVPWIKHHLRPRSSPGKPRQATWSPQAFRRTARGPRCR